MRRPDADSLRNSLPIGVLPVGKSNRFAHSLFPLFSSSGKVESEVEMMAGAAMSCVKSIYRPIDVMQVRFLYVSGFRYCGIEPDRHYALEARGSNFILQFLSSLRIGKNYEPCSIFTMNRKKL